MKKILTILAIGLFTPVSINSMVSAVNPQVTTTNQNLFQCIMDESAYHVIVTTTIYSSHESVTQIFDLIQTNIKNHQENLTQDQLTDNILMQYPRHFVKVGQKREVFYGMAAVIMEHAYELKYIDQGSGVYLKTTDDNNVEHYDGVFAQT